VRRLRQGSRQGHLLGRRLLMKNSAHGERSPWVFLLRNQFRFIEQNVSTTVGEGHDPPSVKTIISPANRNLPGCWLRFHTVGSLSPHVQTARQIRILGMLLGGRRRAFSEFCAKKTADRWLIDLRSSKKRKEEKMKKKCYCLRLHNTLKLLRL